MTMMRVLRIKIAITEKFSLMIIYYSPNMIRKPFRVKAAKTLIKPSKSSIRTYSSLTDRAVIKLMSERTKMAGGTKLNHN